MYGCWFLRPLPLPHQQQQQQRQQKLQLQLQQLARVLLHLRVVGLFKIALRTKLAGQTKAKANEIQWSLDKYEKSINTVLFVVYMFD